MVDKEKPVLVVLTGIMGTGKTTFAKYLAEHLPHYVRVNTDEVRRILGKGGFDPKDTPQVNAHVFLIFSLLLQENKGVVSDSANKTKSARDKIYNTAREHNSPVLVVEFTCSHDTAIKRITSRPARDGLHQPTNKAEDYYEYLKLCENIESDIKDPRNADVTFARVDTDKHTLNLIKEGKTGQTQIQKILAVLREALVEKSTRS